ncbi:hypothetical protein GCM10010182_06780 [Actinomadura cremea]|nr:hypothetical protein GCM10010182_06780 [Actinomadura cremea]
MAVAPVEANDPGRIGRYRIVGRLGRGGMGRVYLGLSPGGRAVAVKVVRDELAEDPGFRRRFVREVDAARRVAGLFTAAVIDADPDGDPPWLATAYVPGMSLEAAVAAHGPWPERSVRALGAALAEGLESVHGAGVVHRDLKPSNVLLAADGPRLIDFGISLAAENTQLTETGMVIGTPGYIAPEQLVRDETSPAGDVFALGAVLAYAAAGSGPFGSGAAHALHYRVVHEPPDLTGVPSGLADVVARCLAKEPGARPTVPDLVAELGGDGAATGDAGLPGPVVAEIGRVRDAPILGPAEPRPTAVDTAPRRRRGRGLARGRVPAGLAAAAALVLVAAGVALAARPSGGDRDDASGPPEWKERWSVSLDGELGLAGVADRTVYLSGKQGDLYALDADTGEERWRQRYPGRYPSLLEGTDEVAYYADGRYTYALDASTGRQLWKDEDDGINGSPTTVGGTTYKAFANWLIEIDPRTGKEGWAEPTEGVMWDDAPVVAAGVLYLADDAALYAVDAENGDGLWRFDAGNDIESGPVYAEGTVYVGGKDGTLYAVDTDSGREEWKHRFDGADWDPATVGGAGVPIVEGGVVYYENDGYVCAFDVDTGRVVWTHEPGLEEDVMLLAVWNGEVLYRDGLDGEGDETVYALDARTGERLWDDALGEGTTAVGDVLFYDDGGRLHAVTATGRA